MTTPLTAPKPSIQRWTFLTNHAHVLIALSRIVARRCGTLVDGFLWDADASRTQKLRGAY